MTTTISTANPAKFIAAHCFRLILLIALTTGVPAQVFYERESRPLNEILSAKQLHTIVGRPKIGLVLSGGGARGIAHVGVLKYFEEHKIPIDLIVGTSVGSVVGGFYAAGYSAEELEKLVREIDWLSLFQDDTERRDLFLGQKKEQDRYLLRLRLDGFKYFLPTSLTPGQKILSILSEKLLDANFQAVYDFDRLKIPFRSVATDLISGNRVVIDKGDMAEAINASIAVPLLFAPVKWGDKMLVDGGLRSNIPVDVAVDLGMDIIVAVDIASPLRKEEELRAPWEIADQVTTIMMNPMRKEQLEKADFVIRPELSGVGSSDFSKIDLMIEEGERAAAVVSPQIVDRINELSLPSVEGSVFITRMEIEPAHGLLNSLEMKGLHSHPFKRISYADIKNDVNFLFSRGRFRSVQAAFRVNSPDTVLCFSLKTNPLMERVSFEGNEIYADSILQNLISHPLGTIINTNRLLDDLEKIREFYRKNGYALMRFSNVEFDTTAQTLHIAVDEGRINGIRIDGNERTESYIILREFPMSRNDIFNSQLARKGISNIYNTQLFRKVSLTLDRKKQIHQLVIKVQEKKYTVLSLGGKIDSERGARAYLNISDDNFMGRGNNIALTAQFGDEIQTINGSYRVDRIFSSYLTFGLQAYYDWRINPFYLEARRRGMYTERRRGIRLLFGQQLKKLGQLTAELKIENVKDERESGEFTSRQDSRLRTLTLRSVTDKRDRIGFTQSGTYNVWYWETGNQRILEGEEKFTKAFVNLETYYTYAGHHTFHARLQAGVADRTLPFSEYFRIGGIDGFMGLHEDEFFGRQMFVTNLEYRYRIPLKSFSDTYLSLRYDIGGVWETPNLVIKRKDLFYGYGGWLGLDTILGPLLVGYGHMTRDRDLFYISIGYDF